jgi:hypothetical protein
LSRARSRALLVLCARLFLYFISWASGYAAIISEKNHRPYSFFVFCLSAAVVYTFCLLRFFDLLALFARVSSVLSQFLMFASFPLFPRYLFKGAPVGQLPRRTCHQSSGKPSDKLSPLLFLIPMISYHIKHRSSESTFTGAHSLKTFRVPSEETLLAINLNRLCMPPC